MTYIPLRTVKEFLSAIYDKLDFIGVLGTAREANGSLGVTTKLGSVITTVSTVTTVNTVSNQASIGGYNAIGTMPFSGNQVAVLSNINNVIVTL